MLSMDEKSTTSATTFPLDEKESLRPDDSASVNAQDEDDGRGSTQPSSQVGSDPEARAFSEQLREISTMGPHSRQQAPIPRLTTSTHGGPGMLYSPSPIPVPNSFTGVSPSLARDPNSISFSPDEKLVEALGSVRDRVWVLKLEQDITDFVKDPMAQSFDLPQCNSFYRMLAHKMADYYLLGHTMDPMTSTVRLWKTPNCRIPPRLSEVTNPSTAASTPPPPLPQMKILRRNDNDTRPSSREGIIDGDSGSDVGKNKLPASREEREARYEAARLRILGSAKPVEDATLALPKESDGSASNSVVGRRKTRKQRSDSEDGFEARSAYSMYPQGNMPPSAQGGLNGYQQQEGISPHFGQPEQYGMQMPYGAPYTQQIPQPWSGGGYGPQPPQWGQGQYGQYDMAGHMQSMSIGSPDPMGNSPGHPMMGRSPSFSPASASNGYAHNYPPPQMYPGQYPGQFSNPMYPNGMPYQYGPQPNQFHGGRPFPSDPTYPPPGNYSPQPYFNPNSQAFVPRVPGPQYGRPPYSNPISPAISHTSASNGGTYPMQHPHPSQSASPYLGSQHHQGPPHQHLVQPNPRTLTHPLPQPVFAQQPNGPQNLQQKGSTIAKFAGASLPAKPPPPANESIRTPSGGQEAAKKT